MALMLSAALLTGCANNTINTGDTDIKAKSDATVKTQPSEVSANAEQKATHKIDKPKSQRKTKTDEMNPAPSTTFNSYSDFVLEEVTIAEKYATHSANKKALAKIQTEMDIHVGSTIAPWKTGKSKTLLIKPRIDEIKFISGKTRFWAGAFVGKSFVLMPVDRSNG